MREKSLFILANFQESTVEEIWHALKTALNSGMETYIPSKTSGQNAVCHGSPKKFVDSYESVINYIKNKSQGQLGIGIISNRSNI